ncbi:MAG: ATP-binding cassette domain-containing protein, partial [Deltaproteobacteria bacterium]|nr:ATP-binding cassette domain-containing protein [Deltaproteobacteria bacterium]
GENILLGNPGATEKQLQQVLEDACLADWIAGLPLGLDTPVGEGGAAVSGGEGRRIALARALLKDAPILLLDEPTEGLGSRTEQALVDRLSQAARGKTVLLISHRPACLALAERVVEMGKQRDGQTCTIDR